MLNVLRFFTLNSTIIRLFFFPILGKDAPTFPHCDRR
jgi:hypothetical protein